MTPASGKFTYQDDYGQIYTSQWEPTSDGGTDYTTIIEQPYVWGELPEGEIVNQQLFRRGIRTIHRQVLRDVEGGVELVLEGYTQETALIQTSFHCSTAPIDPFKFHIDQMIRDDLTILVSDGPRFADPDNPDDVVAIWGTVNMDGSVNSTSDSLQWIDVWS